MHVNTKGFAYRYLKRTLDILLVVLGIVPLLPLLAVLYLLVKMDSKGDALFLDRRIGKGGKLFACYKFRSMQEDADEILEDFFTQNPQAQEEWKTYAKLRSFDPRVTKVGSWMRKYSLDELPQLVNVLKGEMSLVGPRPYLLREKDSIDKESFAIITGVLPGITGLWQVSGRSDVTFYDRVRMDREYSTHWSLLLDIKILLKTVKVVLKGSGAC